MTAKLGPVKDWENDFDVLDYSYLNNPFEIWDKLRDRCPIAHTDRRGSNWLPTTYDDVTKIAHDFMTFSSTQVLVIPFMETARQDMENINPEVLGYGAPPITADPPLQTWTRRLILPWFSHKKVAEYEPLTQSICDNLIDKIIGRQFVDGAVDYAQQIPVRVISHILGVPEEMTDTFTTWVRDFLEFADNSENRFNSIRDIVIYLMTVIDQRKKLISQGENLDDIISFLIKEQKTNSEINDAIVLGMSILLLIAGIDTTWSAIGSALWHLGSNREDLVMLKNQPEIMDTAIEELLRAYSPVTMARVVTKDTDYNGCPMKQGDKVLMNFPAANRDPLVFENPQVVNLRRKINRHIAFGSGIHRCGGANLARMELKVAIRTFIDRLPDFKVDESKPVMWAGGQVRGPRVLPLAFLD